MFEKIFQMFYNNSIENSSFTDFGSPVFYFEKYGIVEMHHISTERFSREMTIILKHLLANSRARFLGV